MGSRIEAISLTQGNTCAVCCVCCVFVLVAGGWVHGLVGDYLGF